MHKNAKVSQRIGSATTVENDHIALVPADEREELNRIGIALSSTHNVSELLEMILAKAREITRADAGSLYLVELSGSGNGLSARSEKQLRFKLIQNDTKQFPFAEDAVPISEDSMAGYSALHREVVAIDDVYAELASPYRFNPRYDRETGYRTRSLLTVPMKNPRGEAIGVMQLINCKRHRNAQLLTIADVEQEVQPFPDRAIRLAESLASQAAVAYENSQLYQSIETLLEGFVQAAVTAIEQRDPSTSGHSLRVATLTVALAEAVSLVQTGEYRDVSFSPEQLKEIRYAALLHDFGKIAVREAVLVKAYKLYPPQISILEHRFCCLHQELETERAEKKLGAALKLDQGNRYLEFAQLDEDCLRKHEQLDDHFRFVLEVNASASLSVEKLDRLLNIARLRYCDSKGVKRALLTSGEVESLLIPEGSLNDEERREIESHVEHSFNFLVQIPWTPGLKYVPWIVRAHHEKVNGKGYPNCLRGDEIPVQAKMMIICDIFDALSSADRPYKKAVTVDRALEVLETAAAKQEIDSELFRIFIEGHICELCSPKSSDNVVSVDSGRFD